MNHERARDLMIEFCRMAWQKSYMAATDGNMSLRLAEGRFLMTPGGRSKALLRPEDLLELDGQGKLISQEGKVSAEVGLHLAVYQARPEAGAVVHAHPPLATAFSATGRGLNIGPLPEALVGFGEVPLVPYATPGAGGDDGLARAVEPFLKDHDALLLAHHGTLALGPDLETAWARTEKLESAAWVLWAAEALGGARPLPLSEQAKLKALGGWAVTPPGKLKPLAQRIELTHLPLTADFAVEKRWEDERGQAHLIVNDRSLRRVGFLTLNIGAGYRGGHVHHNKHEGFYVVSGRAKVELVCEESGERLALEMGPGDRLWVPPKVAHRISALEPLGFVEMTDSPYDAQDDRKFEF